MFAIKITPWLSIAAQSKYLVKNEFLSPKYVFIRMPN